MDKKAKQRLWDYTLTVGGSFVFSAGLNLFIMPCGLLSANFTGVAQIIRGFIMTHTSLPIPPSFNLTGVILALFNIPLMLVAAKYMNRDFLIKTLVGIGAITLGISLIPVPKAPLLDSTITSSIIGGIITGYGIGVVLRGGGTGGGVEILGMIITKRNPSFSVGRIAIWVGVVVLAYCLVQNDLNLIVYSAIYTVVYSLTLDKAHFQTIKTGVFIFSKNELAQTYVIETFGRSATCWQGYGAYTHSPRFISYTVVSKSEAQRLKRELKMRDPGSFIVLAEGVDVMGNYESHL